MLPKEFKGLLETSGLPVAYRFFPKGKVPKLPFIVYYFPDYDDLLADNINYVSIANTNVELYTKNKDFDTEQIVEKIFKENGLYYEKDEAYLESEEMYEVLYEIRLLVNYTED